MHFPRNNSHVLSPETKMSYLKKLVYDLILKRIAYVPKKERKRPKRERVESEKSPGNEGIKSTLLPNSIYGF